MKAYNSKIIVHNIRSAFNCWRDFWKEDFRRKNVKSIKQSENTIHVLEQRVSKLKALLARTHQHSQKNFEEFSNLKRAQQEAADELRSSEIKSNEELKTLREVVRENSVLNAFQYDVDILIQKAGIVRFNF